MIIKYRTYTGEIRSYALVGGIIPDDIPDGEGYLDWNGQIPQPTYNYVVRDNQVVLKEEADRQAYQDSILARSIRGQRDTLLSQSDYVILPDAPYSEDTKAAYRTYRQALRDLPEQAGFPNNITWPTAP